MQGDLTTVLDFYDDPYLRDTEAWVDAQGIDDHGRQYLVLSNTIFHPHGGGQKGDRGQILISDDSAASLRISPRLTVVDTRRTEAGIAHVLAESFSETELERTLVGAEKVRLGLDWDFRQHQMRLHSTAHLLHCFLEQVLDHAVDPPQTSDLQPEYGLNRYDEPDLVTQEQMQHVVDALNRFLAEDHAITTQPDSTPSAREGARLWRCEDWTIPCGGTHPASTAEIGPVSVELSTKRGRTSMTFRLADGGERSSL